MNDSLFEKARDFRVERSEKIKKENKAAPYCVLHWIPTSTTSIDISSIHENNTYLDFMAQQKNSSGLRAEIDFDNLYIFTNDGKDEVVGSDCGGVRIYRRGFHYVRIFRSGELESVYAPRLAESNEQKFLPVFAFKFFREQIERFMMNARSLGYSGPVMVGASLVHVKGYLIGTDRGKIFNDPSFRSSMRPVGRDDLEVSDKLVENIGDIKSVDEIVHPILNELWCGFGLSACDLYDSDGTWNPDGVKRQS